MNCQHCGSALTPGQKFCTNCGAPAEAPVTPVQPPVSGYQAPQNPAAGTYRATSPVIAPRENVFLGFIGALVGALIGGASIILLDQMGYIASISGLLLALCTLKGYQLLAKGTSKTGITICIVLMAITPFLADLLGWGMAVMDEFPMVSFTESIHLFFVLLGEDGELLFAYLKDLAFLYLFVALGAFAIVHDFIKKGHK